MCLKADMQGVAYQPGVLLAFIHVTQKNKNKKLINLKSVVYLNRDKKKKYSTGVTKNVWLGGVVEKSFRKPSM